MTRHRRRGRREQATPAADPDQGSSYGCSASSCSPGWALLAASATSSPRPPSSSTPSSSGINNGALYALIALGYTLVYGIIELINFAHGDLFMLAPSSPPSSSSTGSAPRQPDCRRRWSPSASLWSCAMVFCAAHQRAAERVAYRRLRRAPKLAATHHRRRPELHLPVRRPPWNGSAQKQWPNVSWETGSTSGGSRIEWTTILVIAVTVPLLLLLTWIVSAPGRARRCARPPRTRTRRA